MASARAFCPGHVTGFFEIRDGHQDVLRRGSLGGGLCISLGATSTATLSDDAGPITILLNGAECDAPVSRFAIGRLRGDDERAITVETEFQLPMSQGFGISGAGALSAALAAAKLYGRPVEEAWAAAHAAEVTNGSGLGDVAAQILGGITARRKEGVPPFGDVVKMAWEAEVLVCVIGERLSTKTVLSDPEKRAAINSLGGRCVDGFLDDMRPETLFSLSREFARGTGLMSREVAAAIEAVENAGTASMAMLGNSVFAWGNADELAERLRPFGKVWRCGVDNLGARIIT